MDPVRVAGRVEAEEPVRLGLGDLIVLRGRSAMEVGRFGVEAVEELAGAFEAVDTSSCMLDPNSGQAACP